MSWLTACLIGFLVIRTGVATWNLFFPPAYKAKEKTPKALLSILIPARNEEENLPRLLDQLQVCTYPNLEVIVLDDFSSDQTAEILQEYAQSWTNLRFLPGKPLPTGWLGKNWACHQLGQEAKGDFLLFLDADVAYIHPNLPNQTIQELKFRELALLSIFPTQLMPSLGEKIVVPIMHYLLLSLLPLNWIYKMPFPSMAAANGQFMLFDGPLYRKFQWHQKVKKVIVEDIAIMQAVKHHQLKGMTFLGNKDISCRMYRGYVSGIKGFGKNLLSGFANNIGVLLLYIFLTQLLWLWVLPSLNPSLLTLCLFLIIWMRFCTHRTAREPFWVHIFMHPLHMFTLLLIATNSIYRKISGNNIWKGRNVASA